MASRLFGRGSSVSAPAAKPGRSAADIQREQHAAAGSERAARAARRGATAIRAAAPAAPTRRF